MMMTSSPVHHVPEEDLLEYVAASGSEGAALAIACHVSLCAACAARLRTVEAVGGGWLEAAAPQTLPVDALEQLFSRVDRPSSQSEAPAPDARAEQLIASLGIPRVVLAYLNDGAAASTWRRLVPGITRIELRLGPSSTVARLVNLRPGLEIPLHDHGGTEYIVIFSGALRDDQGRFARGDISIRESGQHHVQHVEPDDACVALVINEGPLRPLTWKGKVLNFIAGN